MGNTLWDSLYSCKWSECKQPSQPNRRPPCVGWPAAAAACSFPARQLTAVLPHRRGSSCMSCRLSPRIFAVLNSSFQPWQGGASRYWGTAPRDSLASSPGMCSSHPTTPMLEHRAWTLGGYPLLIRVSK